MKNLFQIVFAITIILATSSLCYSQAQGSPGQQQNTVTFSTFAAAPIAHYQSILLHPNDNLSDPCTPGTIFFSALQNDLLYCQDAGNGTGSFNLLSGGPWKKSNNNIFPKDTATNPNILVGIGTSTPIAALDVDGSVHFEGGGGDLFWEKDRSHLSFGTIDMKLSQQPQIGINLGLSAAPVLMTDNTMAIVGGKVIIGSTFHNHIAGAGGGGVGGGGVGGGGGAGGGAVNLTNTVLTADGDSDFVGNSYFHEDVAMENDLTVGGNFTVSGNANLGPLTASSLTVGTINAARICVNGACGDPFWKVWVNGQIHETSDGRFKTNLKPIASALETIAALNPIEYQWKKFDKDASGKIVVKDGVDPDVHLGMIAQDVYKVIPEVVHKPTDEEKNLWGINYTEIVPVLIQAIKEQQAEIDLLKQELSDLKKSP